MNTLKSLKALKDGLSKKDAISKGINVRSLKDKRLIIVKDKEVDKKIAIPKGIPRWGKKFKFLRMKYRINADGSTIDDMDVSKPLFGYKITTVKTKEPYITLTSKGEKMLKGKDEKEEKEEKGKKEVKKNIKEDVKDIKEEDI